MDEICNRLYVGSWDDAQQHDAPQICLNLAEQGYAVTSPRVCLHRPIPDEVMLSRDVWAHLVTEAYAAYQSGASMLIHCRLGVSRAPTLTAALMAVMGKAQTPLQALQMIRAKRSIINPHPETLKGMLAWWDSVRSTQVYA